MDGVSKMKSDPWKHNQDIEHNHELDNMVPADLGRRDICFYSFQSVLTVRKYTLIINCKYSKVTSRWIIFIKYKIT